MVSHDWYRTYFSEPYGRIYAEYLLPPEMTQCEAAFACQALDLSARDEILDCPCGFGRHMEELRGRGLRVTGVDLSADCLARAVQWTPALRVARGDMRALPFAGQAFDAAVNLFNSFGYFPPEENAQAIRELGRVLRPGGRILIDTANPGPLVELIQEHPRTCRQTLDLTLTEDWHYAPETRILTNKVRIRLAGKSLKRGYRMRLYGLEEMKDLFLSGGLRLREVFGGFDGESYDAEDSPRLILVGER
jgi:SAM-dependent methyltransferase